jgi:predicted nucleic acid-binding protein
MAREWSPGSSRISISNPKTTSRAAIAFDRLISPRRSLLKNAFVAAVRKRISKILAKGDEAVLSLAFQEGASEIVCDDDGLGKIAMALAFKVTATPDLLREALRRKALRLESYEIAMRGLVIENRLISAIAELYIVEGRKDVEG